MKLICYDSKGRYVKSKRVKRRTIPIGRMRLRVFGRITVPRDEDSDWYQNDGKRKYPEPTPFGVDLKYRDRVGKTDQPYRGLPVKPVNQWEKAKPKEERAKVHKPYVPMIIGAAPVAKRMRKAKPGRKRAPIVKVYGKIVFRKVRGIKRFVKRTRATVVESQGN